MKIKTVNMQANVCMDYYASEEGNRAAERQG